MKMAVVGSRGLNIDSLEPYVPPGVTEIVSGGARGVDTCAAAYAQTHGLKLTVFLPEYTRYGRSAPPVPQPGDRRVCGRGAGAVGRSIPQHRLWYAGGRQAAKAAHHHFAAPGRIIGRAKIYG